jgi:hypothetical protein
VFTQHNWLYKNNNYTQILNDNLANKWYINARSFLMPEITRFYGIIIKMYFNDHLPAHFHALYGEYNGIFEIDSLNLIEGDLPIRARKMVEEWANEYKADLQKIWKTQKFTKLPGLK